MNCITQIHNVKNTPIYFIVAVSLIGSPAQLYECLQPTLLLHRPLQPVFTAGCACVHDQLSALVPSWRHYWGSQQPPQHCRPPTALQTPHSTCQGPHGGGCCGIPWPELSRLCVSPPFLELSHNSVLGALQHYTQGHSTFRGTLACRWRSFHTEASSSSLEEVTAAS